MTATICGVEVEHGQPVELETNIVPLSRIEGIFDVVSGSLWGDDDIRVYLEGGDCWAYDSTAGIYCSAFGISGQDDGSGDTGTILGQSGTIGAGLTLQYTGDNNWMDHLGALAGASVIFRNQSPSYGNGVAFDAGTYKSIGVSFEFGGIGNGAGYNRLDWMVEILKYFDFTKPSGSPWGSH